MVLLTMTPMILEALQELQSLDRAVDEKPSLRDEDGERQSSENRGDENESQIRGKEEVKSGQRNDGENGMGNSPASHKEGESTLNSKEPSLSNPKLGNPISHGQIIDLWKELKTRSSSPRTLDMLLRGARVYIPPPKPKPEPTSEYKALMARLRREEEARSYKRMTEPAPPMETFAERFPLSSSARAFASTNQPINDSDADDGDITYADVDRQLALIFNVLLSIVACAAAIWVAARWWSTPARLAVSFAGSLLVGVAEVVVYGGYIRRLSEARGKERALKEVKEVVRTWVVGAEGEGGHTKGGEEPVLIEKEDPDNVKARRRKKDVRSDAS